MKSLTMLTEISSHFVANFIKAPQIDPKSLGKVE
jgi:hypothetical protein